MNLLSRNSTELNREHMNPHISSLLKTVAVGPKLRKLRSAEAVAQSYITLKSLHDTFPQWLHKSEDIVARLC